MESTRSERQKADEPSQQAKERQRVQEVAGEAPLPAEWELIGRFVSAVPGAPPPPPLDARQIATLQGALGNRAVSRLVDRNGRTTPQPVRSQDVSSPPALSTDNETNESTQSDPAEVGAHHPLALVNTSAPRVQRQNDEKSGDAGLVQREDPPTTESPPASFTMPGEFTLSGADNVVTDRPGANAALRWMALSLISRGEELDAQGEREFSGLAKTVQQEAERYAGEGPLTDKDARSLGSFLAVARGTAAWGFESAMTRTAEAIGSLFTAGTEIDSVLGDLDEAAHQQFIATNQDELGKVLAAITSANELASKIKDYAGKATKLKEYTSGLGAFDGLVKMAEKLKSGAGKVGELLGEAKEIVSTARQIGTLAGVANTSNGTAMMQSVGQFEAAIGLVDKTVGKFGKAVPVFGDLWSKWYKPMVDQCIKSLKVIAKAEEREGRESEIVDWLINPDKPRDPCGAPAISAMAKFNNYFPGGQPVLNYLYVLRHGGSPSMNDAVRDYFLDRSDLFNAGGDQDKLEESDWKLLSPTTWWRSGRTNNLAAWLQSHVGMVWGVLYGDLGQYIN